MTAESASSRSRYRTVLNVCSVIWFVTCGLLLLSAIALAGFSIYGLIAHPVDAQGVDQSDTLRKGIYLAIACGLVDVGIVIYGRRYFRRAYVRIAELEKMERRGPRRG